MGNDNRDQLVKISKVLGTEDLYKYLKKYGLKLEEELAALIEKCPRKPWGKFVKPEIAHLCSDEALDLLDKMLQYDHVTIRTKTGLAHPSEGSHATQVLRSREEMNDDVYSHAGQLRGWVGNHQQNPPKVCEL